MDSVESSLNEQTVSQATSTLIPGGRFRRWVAIILDNFFLGLFQVLLVLVSQLIILRKISLQEVDLDIVLDHPVVILAAILIVGLYKIGFLVKDEATPGKRWRKIKVVRTNGERIRLLRASVREISKIIYYIPLLGLLPYLASTVLVLFSKERRALHDLISGTIVIKTQS